MRTLESAPAAPQARDDTARQRIARAHHREVLAAATIAVAVILLLDVRSDGQVAFRLLPEHPLPEACLSRRLFAHDCPGCGLTRSLSFLAEGRISESLRRHPLGWLVAVAVLCQFPYRAAALRNPAAEPRSSRVASCVGWTTLLLLIGNWLLDLVR